MQTEILPAEIKVPRSRPLHGRVLVADDEPQNRILLSDALEAHHFEIVEAENGFEALEKVRDCAPDVILLDLMMPGMDGLEVCRRLKKEPVTAAIPVLMVTALSERKERLMSIAAGANDFLTKPVDVQDLILRVGNAVHSKHLFDELQAERRNSEGLLLNILPARIAARMKEGETNIADQYPDASVLVTDLVGFTTLCSHVEPGQIVSLLNEIFSAFDALVETFCLEKVKTVGDGYMVAGGIGSSNPTHLEAMAELALAMKSGLAQFNRAYNTSFQIRTGISVGPIVAGVIGRQRFAYDIWGSTVNAAFHIESIAASDAIQVSEAAYERLKDKYSFSRKTEPGFSRGSTATTFTLLARRSS